MPADALHSHDAGFPLRRALPRGAARGAAGRADDRPGRRSRPGSARGRSGLALLVFGTLLDAVHKIAERLDATLVNMRFVKPLDEDLVIELSGQHRAFVTIEENAVAGGAGSAVAELLTSEGLQLPLLQIGIPDRFIEHGSRDSCLAAAGLDAASLNATIEHWWPDRPGTPAVRWRA